MWKNVPHLKRLLEICLKMADDKISIEELQQFIYFYENEKPENRTFKTELEFNNGPGPSYNVLNVQEILAEIKNENADVGEPSSQGNCVKFQKLTSGKENCRGKCKVRAMPSSDELSSTDEDTKSNTRLRNAKRKRKVKKWIPSSKHSNKTALNDHNTSASICTTLNLSNTATSSKTDGNRTRDISTSTCIVASTPTNQSGIGKTAFERSIEKLNHSIEVTNNRLASFAECLAQAIEDSENNTDDNNNQTVS
uniref:Uncharacterized protein n=1 Tax=Ciona savignyi TaxID=51511 RepID=H2Z3P1_CIOSA